jgi:hypothetical protein
MNEDNGIDEIFDALPPDGFILSDTIAEAPQYRTSWTDTELLQTTFPDPNWAVNNLIPEGLTILGGRPKVGKSILALQLALSVKTGGKFLGADIAPGNVLYFALEDNGRRLLERMKTMNWTDGEDYIVQFETELSPLQKPDGFNQLTIALEQRKYKVVIIDTIERAMPGADKSDEKIMGPVYGKLQSMALKRQLAIMVIDHLRKPTGFYSDPVDDVIGSTAKASIADTIIALIRERGKAEQNLRGRGRDINDFDLQIHYEPQTKCYQSLGDANTIELTERRTEIVDALDFLGKSQVKQIAEYTGQDQGNTFRRLQDMANSDMVVRTKEGNKVYYANK